MVSSDVFIMKMYLMKSNNRPQCHYQSKDILSLINRITYSISLCVYLLFN